MERLKKKYAISSKLISPFSQVGNHFQINMTLSNENQKIFKNLFDLDVRCLNENVKTVPFPI